MWRSGLSIVVLTWAVSARAQTTTTLLPETTTTVTETTTTTTLTATTLPSTTTTITSPGTTSTSPATSTTTTLVRPGSCSTDAGCEDGNPCTLDSCSGAFLECTHRPLDAVPCPDDGVFCTRDRCAEGVCRHVPADTRCDRGDCTVRACLPEAKGRDRQGCVKLEKRKKRDGTRCTSDGFSCTDDVCQRGTCLHVPVDTRCVPDEICRGAACAPTRFGHDAAGCIVGAPREEGAECVEDGNVCTRDVCRGGLCAHEEDTTRCAPVQGAFERASGLEGLAGEIGGAAVELGGGDLDAGRATLAVVEAQFDIAAAVLAGRISLGPLHAAGDAVPSAIDASDRARIAFTTVLRTPQQVSQFLNAVTEAQRRDELATPASSYLRARGRALLRSVRSIRAELRRLHRQRRLAGSQP